MLRCPALPNRIADKFTYGPDCWEWTAARNASGYGLVSFNGTTRGAHRVIYELMVGPIPDGLQIDHLCRVRAGEPHGVAATTDKSA